MKIIEQSHEILRIDDIKLIEQAGRTCYKSESKITDDSADAFVKGLVKRKHTAMIEHGGATVKFITDRGATHEIVRHRIASYAQESTRYVNYENGVEYIRPIWLDIPKGDYTSEQIKSLPKGELKCFLKSLLRGEKDYKKFIVKYGWSAEKARALLHHAVKAEIIVTMNFRGWLHFFDLRAEGTTGRPHPQVQALVRPVHMEFAEIIPSIFGSKKGANDGVI